MNAQMNLESKPKQNFLSKVKAKNLLNFMHYLLSCFALNCLILYDDRDSNQTQIYSSLLQSYFVM